MTITVADVTAANFNAFTQLGDQLGAQVGAMQERLEQGRRAVARLRAQWEGSGSDAATKAGTDRLADQRQVVTATQRVQSVLSDGGSRLVSAQNAVVQGVQRLEQQGWQVASDGTVSVRSGSVLERYAQLSPVVAMTLRQLSATGSLQLKQLLAQIEREDSDLAQTLKDAIKDLDNIKDAKQDKPDDGSAKNPDDKGDQPDHPEKPDSTPAGKDPVEIAKQYKGRWATDLMNNSDLPMQKGIDPTECCANFASAVLVKSGMLDPSEQTVSVNNLYNTLQSKGWQTVPAGQTPPPGAVAIFGAGHDQHVEFVESSTGGNITLIGSNNTGAGGSGPQHVSEESPWSSNITYLVPPSNTNSAKG
ncbi:hypothetical protein A5792_28295 [Mycolicibacterium peregrinum]|uniref:Peptidase C51 domain-containing protein n=1 Tax=Mycolicibacterium peregrinum TaxID=43304 RepID=A0A1A0QU17_MYCPR|nr:CHAP domain-containing protein [Mycolicibacterium peregrinum]OBB25646.1 hypothetical protein A5792_28295 [Mycolicibacterium peregrinum]